MAIQLARAIGMQGGIPQSNLPQIIQKVGSDIAAGIERAGERKEKKALKDQALKDAVVASMKIDPPKAHPKDIKAWEDISAAETQDLVLKSIQGKMTPMQIQAEAEKKRIKLENIKLQAERDYAGYIAGEKQETQKEFHTDLYRKVLEGYPDMETEEEDKDAVTKYNNEKNEIEESRKSTTEDISSSSDLKEDDKQKIIERLNKTFDEKLANLEPPKKVKKTIAGQKPYFDIPLESRFESGADLGVILEGTKVRKSVGALKALQSYIPNFKPESLIDVNKDRQGVIVATPNQDKINATKKSYIAAMTSPADYGVDFDIERKAIYDAAIKRMDDDKVPESQRVDKLPEYIATGAGASFDRMMETTINEETRKTNEARLLKGRTGSDSAEDKKAKVAQITTQQPPALTRLGEKFAEKNEKKAKEAEDKAKRFERAGNVDQKYINSLKKSAQDFKELAKRSREQEFKVEDYYVFSSKPTTDDPSLSLTDEDNKTVKNFVPSYVFKKDGKYYIGGTVPKKDSQGKAISNEFEDVYVPYNEQNYRTLQQNRKGLTEELTKQGGYPTWSGKEAKGSKQYKASDVTQSLVNNLKDGEIVFVDGVKRIKQDGKLKKVKQ